MAEDFMEESSAIADPPAAQVHLPSVEHCTTDDVVQKVHNIQMDLALNEFSPKAIDPSKGPMGSQCKKGKNGLKWWYFKNLSHTFLSNSSLSEFKNTIFTKVDRLKAGLGSIL
ncbi:hypothetical protein CROQUDRAFT_97583 [Cronartium quercuum f. sp. fusiforme G11]|uniref:Uncharacterized protein n=1 Tax=Cronartium quercuum f. sp. fusiforme G11 TaxID=708437 RepID=A0A9P6T9E0_9BASI|nr:hypothetical protein CROQUDRAFT_97583 [Cronartium quercuum f. sp. fusiforme G11]